MAEPKEPTGNPFKDLNAMSDSPQSGLMADAEETQEQLDRGFDPISAAKRDHERKELESPAPRTSVDVINGRPEPRGPDFAAQPFVINASIDALKASGFGYKMYQDLVTAMLFKLVDQQLIDLRKVPQDELAAHTRAACNLAEVTLHTTSLRWGRHQMTVDNLRKRLEEEDSVTTEPNQGDEATVVDKARPAKRKAPASMTKA